MSTVAIYKFIGVFPVLPEFLKDHPGGTVSRQGILFLRQAGIERDDAAAIAACLQEHGLRSVEIEAFGVLDIVALARDSNKHLAPNYEQAVQDGSSLIFYAEPPRAPDTVVQGGFRPSSR